MLTLFVSLHVHAAAAGPRGVLADQEAQGAEAVLHGHDLGSNYIVGLLRLNC